MTTTDTTPRFDPTRLQGFATAILTAAGLPRDRAQAVAEVLLAADLLGHDTHGLALLPWYLDAASTGAMTLLGEPEVLVDRGACLTWNGRRLPGAWLASRALDLAMERAPTYGTVTVVIRECGHVGALATYMERAASRGLVAIMASSTPSVAGVAPFGSTQPVMTPNPIAAGLPTEADPILLDISASITTLNKARQLSRDGLQFPAEWVLTRDGRTSADPDVVVRQGGSLLPVGGLDHGHKGYSLALLVEALTQGLSGFGRADGPKGTSVSLFLQVIDPDAFGGKAGFARQTQFLAEACRSAQPIPGGAPVRVPGDRAATERRTALVKGVPLDKAVVQGIEPWAARLDVPMPGAMGR
jgi:LDH2 family malate/lactate/ureidoglycolate dehydrogenase